MHAVFVVPRFFPYRGGYENSLLALAQYLVAHGHRATVLTTVADDLEAFWLPGFKTFSADTFQIGRVQVRRFPICYNAIRRRATRVLGLVPYWRWKAEHWRPSFRVPGLADALTKIDADLLHIGPLPYNGLMYAGLRAGELRKIPVVATPCAHLGEPGNSEVEQQYLAPHQVQMLRHCERVLCMTETERRHLQKLGLAASRLAVAPHGINLAATIGGDPEFLRKRYNLDGPVVLHMGMKAHDKGSETLVEAMKILWDAGSTAWLVMAGPSISTFDSFLADAGRNCSRLLNLPPFGETERRDLLASATIVVQPSRVESLGLVMMESWANRKPVIAADIEVSRELIAGSGGGVTVPFGNPRRLAAGIADLLENSELRKDMGAAGSQVAARYDGSVTWPRIMQQFEQVLARDKVAVHTSS